MKRVFLILISAFLLFPCYLATGQTVAGIIGTEGLFLHTDRNFYIAGDNIFFKLYLTSTESGSSRFAYLVIRDERSNEVSHSRLEIINGISYGSIKLADTLKTGFYQIVCFTNYMRNQPESIFKKEIIIANRFDDEVAYFKGERSDASDKVSDVRLKSTSVSDPDFRILTGKNIYGRREKISFTIDPGTVQFDDLSSLSVSVSQVLDYSAYADNTEKLSEKQQSQPNTKNGGNGFFYERESDRSAIQGRVKENVRTLKPGNNLSTPTGIHTVFVSTIDTIPNLQYTLTDSLGRFTLFLDPYYEGKEIWLKLWNRADAEIRLDSRFGIPDPFQPTLNFDRPKVREFIRGAVKSGQVIRYYGLETRPDTILSFHSFHPVPAVYLKSYPRIYPADYIELDDLFEISREIIPALRIRKSDGSYSASYPSLQSQSVPDEEPLVFLDGVSIDNIGQMITLGSRDIRYIETVPEVRFFKGIYFNGILNVTSRNNALKNVSLSQPFIQLETEESLSFTRTRNFIPADLPAHYPDLRYVLLWEPDLRPEDGEMDFTIWSSDIQGDFEINVQGMMKNGQPVSGTAIITIKAK